MKSVRFRFKAAFSTVVAAQLFVLVGESIETGDVCALIVGLISGLIWIAALWVSVGTEFLRRDIQHIKESTSQIEEHIRLFQRLEAEITQRIQAQEGLRILNAHYEQRGLAIRQMLAERDTPLKRVDGGALVNVVLFLALLVSIASTAAFAWTGEILLAVIGAALSTALATGIFLAIAPIAPSNHEEMR